MRRNALVWRLVTAAVLLVGVWACKDIPGVDDEGLGGPSAGVTDTIQIIIENFDFRAPNGTDSLTIALGQTVKFINLDAAPHTATSTSTPAGGSSFDSGRLSQGEAYYWTPLSTGVWVYRCDFHPVDMSGAVLMVGEGGAPPDTTGTGGGGGDVAFDTVVVDIVNFSFRGPGGSSRIEIAVGQTIKFVNRDPADHTATSTSGPAGGFNSGNLDTGQVYHWTPSQTGNWSFVCDYHPEMTGTVVVSDSTGGGGDDGGGASTVRIDITDSGFVGPGGNGDATIGLGDAVEWVNAGQLAHTVSAKKVPEGAERFDSGDLAPGASYVFTPDRVGLWEYRCDIHGGEEGIITVQ